jgi:hypothetical protein
MISKTSLLALSLASLAAAAGASPATLALEAAEVVAKPTLRGAATHSADAAANAALRASLRETMESSLRTAAESRMGSGAAATSKPAVVIVLKDAPKTAPVAAEVVARAPRSWWKEISAGTVGTGTGAGIYGFARDCGTAVKEVGAAVKQVAKDAPWVVAIWGVPLVVVGIAITGGIIAAVARRCGSLR